jgi:NADH-quinone oxidoreductase subunit M
MMYDNLVNHLINNIVNWFSTVSVVSILFLLILPNYIDKIYNYVALAGSFCLYCLSLITWIFFGRNVLEFQFLQMYETWPVLHLNLYFGLDGISLFFLLLTTFLFPFCILAS